MEEFTCKEAAVLPAIQLTVLLILVLMMLIKLPIYLFLVLLMVHFLNSGISVAHLLVKTGPPHRAVLPLSDADGAHRALVPGALGRVQHPVGDLPAVGKAVVSHGKYLRAVPGAQAAADAAFIYRRVHRVSPILKKICPVPEERGGKASVPHFLIFTL